MALSQVAQIGPRQKQKTDSGFGQFGKIVGGIGGGIAGALVGGPLGAIAGATGGSQLGQSIGTEFDSDEDEETSLRGAIDALRSQPREVQAEFTKPLVEALIVNKSGAKVSPRPQQISQGALQRRL